MSPPHPSRPEPEQSPSHSQSFTTPPHQPTRAPTTSPTLSGPSSHRSPPHQRQQQQRQVNLTESYPGGDHQRPSAPPPAAARARDHASRDRAASPEVYWSEARNQSPSQSQFTFYREGTPTPPEYAGDEEEVVGGRRDRGSGGGRRLGSGAGDPSSATAAGAAAAEAAAAYETARSIEPKEPRPPKRKVCGLSRRAFWLVVVLVLLAVAVGVGVGVGIGVGGRQRSGRSTITSSSTDTQESSSSSSSSSSTTTTTSPSARSTTTASASSPAGCPAANNTIYEVPRSDKRFLRLCGVDYSGARGAVDLSNVPTSSFAECMNNCAGTVGCTGCGWGPVKGDVRDEHACWLKGTLRASHTVSPHWSFAILQ